MQKKITLYGKKNYIDFFLFTEKACFTENEKNIYLICEIFFYPENIYSFCKTKVYLLNLRGELNNLVLKVSEEPNMWYSLN